MCSSGKLEGASEAQRPGHNHRTDRGPRGDAGPVLPAPEGPGAPRRQPPRAAPHRRGQRGERRADCTGGPGPRGPRVQRRPRTQPGADTFLKHGLASPH